MIVRDKSTMYRMLDAGAFGNTINQYFSVDDWKSSNEYDIYDWWGVRSQIPGGPCRLFCPRAEVEQTVKSFGCEINISVMVDRVCDVLLWADIYESTTGLTVYGVENPPKGGSWRTLMPVLGKQYNGISAKMLLRRCLNPNALDDLALLLDEFPDHVVELSALSRCMGRVPGRNAVVWEVRSY